MGKSLGNAIYLKDLFRRFDPLVVRYFILNSHYRSPLDFTDEALTAAERGLQRLHNGVRALRAAMAQAPEGEVSEEVRQVAEGARAQFTAAMDDDFNTAGALAALFDLARASNTLLAQRKLNRQELETLEAPFRELGGEVLGVVPDELTQESVAGLEQQLIELLIDLRRQFRAERQWAQADAIRDRLAALGVQLEDKPEGTTYRLVSAE
jgi:cysteinyl-tRNA synthetase